MNVLLSAVINVILITLIRADNNTLKSVKNYFLCAWRTLFHGLDSLAIFLSFYTDYFFILQTNVLFPLSSF